MESHFGIANVWTQGDWVTRSVALVLLAMSLTTWVIILWKAMDQRAQRAQAQPLRLAQGGLRPGVDSVDVLAWSADGQSLAGLGQLQEGGTHAERWSAQNGRRLPSGTWPQEGLPTSLQGLPDGGWLLATSRLSRMLRRAK